MYTNLILFLVAIFLFTVDSVPEEPLLPALPSLLVYLGILLAYGQLVKKMFSRRQATRAAGYFQAEKRLSVTALVFFAATLYLCDPKYYLSLLSLGNTMPVLVNFAGLGLFVLFLIILWRGARRSYELVFDRHYTSAGFIRSNIKANLPIVLPWLILSLCYDLLALLPLPGVQSLLASTWGDILFFGVFLFFVLLFFPPLVRRLWGCRKMPEGRLKDHLLTFCASQNFKAELYLWPLFEGRVLTAGVMGIVPGLRYILITPALLETMTLSELESVMAHEIGHVKKYHLLLYVMLIGGFSLFTMLLAEPLIYLLLSFEPVTKMIIARAFSPETVLTLVGAVPLLIFLLIYFRYVFGYFIRNFERQADLFSLAAIGNSQAMVSAFEKIAVLSGNIRDQPNWHHFGIGERIDCLEKAEREPERIERHNRKVRFSLLAYIMIVVLVVTGVQYIPTDTLVRKYQENFAEVILMHKVRQEPDRAIWLRLIGDLMLTRKMETKALAAYQQAMQVEPTNPEVLNNFAWLLLTAENLELRDPGKALTLARAAATLSRKGYILDTLATAYWANGLVEEAVATEEEAIREDIAQKRFYQSQITRFTSQSYEQSVAELRAAQNTGGDE